MAHYFPYDVKLRLLAHSRSFLANQKARNAIVGKKHSDYEPIVGVLRHMENIAPSFQLQPSIMAEIKIGGKTQFENLLKQLFHSPLLDMK